MVEDEAPRSTEHYYIYYYYYYAVCPFRLNRCGLTQKGCEKLASVLSCPTSHLRELDLSDNDVEDSGVQLLSTGLGNVCCKLEALRYHSQKTINPCLGFLKCINHQLWINSVTLSQVVLL